MNRSLQNCLERRFDIIKSNNYLLFIVFVNVISKTVRLGRIEVSLVSVTSQLDPIPILTASAESVVQLKIDQSSEGIDIDIALSDIRLQLQKRLVDQIVSVISSFCRTGSKSANSSHGFPSLSESVMKVVNNNNKGDGLQWLRTGEDLDRDEQINYRDVIEQIKQVVVA